MQDLVVITGPIASGKSTVADLLARRCAAEGRSAATVDLDEVAFAQHGCTELDRFWSRAGVAHAALVRGWLAAGTQVVIAHGPLHESGSYEALTVLATPSVRVHEIALAVSVEVALERVAADADRAASALSCQPDFLRSAHRGDAARGLPPEAEVLDTDRASAAELAERIAARMSVAPA